MSRNTPQVFLSFAIASAFLLAMAMTPTVARADHGSCGQPASNGHRPASVDALVILKSAVGQARCGDDDDNGDCECDVDSSGSITPKDALKVLRKAVGFPGGLDCPEECAATTTTTEEGAPTTTLEGLPLTTTTTLQGGPAITTTTLFGQEDDDDDDGDNCRIGSGDCDEQGDDNDDQGDIGDCRISGGDCDDD